MFPLYLRTALFLLGLGCFHILVAQTRQVQTFTVADGLAQSQVYAVLADSRGYIWAGTQGGGLARYDGIDFTTFSDVNGLADNYVQALHEGQSGDLWIGTRRGLSRFDGRQFYNQLPYQSILAIAADGADFYALSFDAIFKQNGTDWDSIPFPKPYLRVYDLLVREGRILLGTDRGAWAYERNRWQQLRADFPAAHQVWALEQIGPNTAYALAPGGQLFRVGRDSLLERPIPAQTPTVYYVDQTGTTWLGTQNEGVFYLPKDRSQWQRIRRRDNLGSNHIRAITEDRWGNIWVGTSGGGLSVLRQAPFRAYDTQHGLPAREVYALAQDDSLGIVFSNGNKGVFRLTADGPVPLVTPQDIRTSKIKSLHIDSAQNLWLATPGNGLYLKTDSSEYAVTSCGKYVLDLQAIPNSDNWWVATAYEGLSLLQVTEDSTGLQFSCRSYGREAELPLGRIESLYLDRRGRLLIAYRDSGLACWTPGKLHWQLRTTDGLPSNNVRAVRQDSIGYYWLATARGLVRVGESSQGPQLRVFRNTEGLQSNNLYSLTLDQHQHLWVGSERGVDHLELDAARNPRQITFYGRDEGFTGIENCTNAALTVPDGTLWFGTMNGLMQYNTAPQRTNNRPPPTLALRDVQLRYRSVRDSIGQQLLSPWGSLLPGEITLEYAQNQVGFQLQAVDQIQADAVQYQWQLAGWEQQWSLPSAQGNASYANLPPGQYTFRARAIGSGNRRSEVLSIPVEIIPAFWQTVPFRITLLVALIVLALLLVWTVFRRYRRQQERIAERLRLDNRLLELEQKALQLQMNPHFLANALQGIQHELLTGAHERANRYLTKFGALMRSTLHHSRSNRIPLSDEVENLRHYLDLERFRLSERFEYAFHFAEALEVDLIEIPPMLLQPFLENAIHHGLRSKQTGGRIDITITEESTAVLLVKIADNGIGLRASATQKAAGHQSTALRVIKERLTLLGAEDTAFQMEEQRSENGTTTGVLVTVRLPILDGS
ncbi:MAG: two-component regulator propeller domain-containing protein [Bacteroidota bacterium]